MLQLYGTNQYSTYVLLYVPVQYLSTVQVPTSEVLVSCTGTNQYSTYYAVLPIVAALVV